MSLIDIDKFLWMYQAHHGELDDSRRQGLRYILNLMNADTTITNLYHRAYMLATVKLECDNKWQPIAEYGKGKGRAYGRPDPKTGLVYYGRGLTQNTWYENYLKLTKAWNKTYPDRPPVDFTRNPDLLLQMEYSYFAMSYSMRKGLYTGVGLSKYINDEKCDLLNARRIINGMDCAEKIAEYAAEIADILKECEVMPT